MVGDVLDFKSLDHDAREPGLWPQVTGHDGFDFRRYGWQQLKSVNWMSNQLGARRSTVSAVATVQARKWGRTGITVLEEKDSSLTYR